jgi:phosphoenolpyruvate carboxykinase (GTP)
MRFGEDGRLYAINPEAGFFGVAPGTGEQTNANAVRTFYGNSIFTNVALTADGDVWWEGLTETPPDGLTDWKGRPWTPDSDEPAATPTAASPPRPAVPDDRRRVGGPEGRADLGDPVRRRRASAVPLVTESFDWQHGTFLGRLRLVRDDGGRRRRHRPAAPRPFAMLPFCGYNMGDYMGTGSRSASRPTRRSCRGCTTSTGSARTTTASGCGPASGRTAAS